MPLGPAFVCRQQLRAENLRQLLDGAEGDPVAGGEDECRHHGRPDKLGAEELPDAWAAECASGLLLRPHRALGEERPDQNQRQGRDDAGDEGVAPGLVAAMDRGEHAGVLGGEDVGHADEQAAER